MRRALAWGLAVPLAAGGAAASHWLAYRLAVPDPRRREHVLEHSGHGYLEYVPLALALLAAAAGVAFVSRVVQARRRAVAGELRWPVALLPIVAFACLEHAERWLHEGAFPVALVLDRTFVVGLLLQLPVGLLAYLLARALIKAADRIGLAFSPRARRGMIALAATLAAQELPGPSSTLARGYAGRAPPLPSPS